MPQDPLDYLASLERLGMKFGLRTISRLCAALGHPERSFRSVVVGGTNGKGSVTAMVERGLRAAGHRSARYTSPHLVRLEERFFLEGHDVATDRLRWAAREVQRATERLLSAREIDAPPTYFEFATAVAFVLFRAAAIEVGVLEVGLGGRLDATNVATPIAVAITSIDFDHQEQLGDTLAAIAREKAGIIRPGIPVVCGPLPGEAERVIRGVCASAGAEFVSAPVQLPLELGAADLALRGAHQRTNASVAATLLQRLDALGVGVDAASIRTALTDVDWPGRLEEFRFGGADVLIDAAHNPAGARALTAFLRAAGWTDCALVFGAMKDKDAAAMLAELQPVCRAVVCTTAPSPRAAAAADLADVARRTLPGAAIEIVPDAAAALERACAVRPRVVVAGSIFLVGPLRAILRKS